MAARSILAASATRSTHSKFATTATATAATTTKSLLSQHQKIQQQQAKPETQKRALYVGNIF